MSVDFNLKCRTCLNETNTYYKSIEDVEECYNILEMLDSVVPHINIRLTSSSTLYSTLVCEICVEKLLISYKFQQMCIKSNEILENVLPTRVIEHEDFKEFNDDPLTIVNEENLEEDENNADEEIISYVFADNDDSCSRICTKEDVMEQTTIKIIHPFQCQYCPKTFEKHKSLAAHCKVHKKKILKNKKTVDSDFNHSQAIKVKIEENEDEKIADFNTIKKEDVNSPIQKHNEALIDDLNNHLHSKPEAKKRKYNKTSKQKSKKPDFHICKICGKIFKRLYTLKKHKTVHYVIGPHECNICKKIFKHDHRLEQHMLVHKSSLCPHCGKTFVGTFNLRSHVERCEGKKNYQCPDCPKRFNCKSDLLYHSQTHSNAKPHVCDICGARFTRNFSMRNHKKLVHVAERSFKCDQCGMTFKQLHNLKRHMRTHTGEKPYKCTYCECAYTQSGDLIKHVRTHIGVNTYRCDQCPEAFKYLAELRQHISLHYKMEQERKQAMSEKGNDDDRNEQNEEKENQDQHIV